MEVFVEFEVSCENARRAELITSLFQSLSQNKPWNEIASSLEGYNLDSNEISALEKLAGNHLENLGGLETAEADGKVFRSTFVCGRGAEKFLVGLAKVSAKFQSSIIRLTAQYDEGVYVCDWVDGKLRLEEFEDYETYQQAGFVELENESPLPESTPDSATEASSSRGEKDSQQPLQDAGQYAEQERAVLAIAQKFHEDNFNGIPLDFGEWYSDEYHAAGWLDWLESPENAAQANKEWADSHDGVKSIDLTIKGQLEGLVSIDAQISMNDGKVKDSNSCWIYQNDRWKMHNSCTRIWVETQELSNEALEALKKFEELLTQSPLK